MWAIKKDYDQKVPYFDAKVKNKCEYITEIENCSIRKIVLWNCIDNIELILIDFRTKAAGENFKTILHNKKITAKNHIIRSDCLECKSESKHDSEVIIGELFKFEPLIIMTLDNLCNDLKISNPCKLTIDELKKTSITEAVKLAKEGQKNRLPDLIWQLAKLYYEDTLSENPIYKTEANVLYDLLNDINEQNPHYQKAQDMCVDLIMRLDLEPQEKLQYLELKFTHALKGSRQNLTDRLYHELCGYAFTDHFVQYIKGEENTLLCLAEQMRELNKKLYFITEQKTNEAQYTTFFSEKRNEAFFVDRNIGNNRKNSCDFKMSP